jgi:dienelactone hydrolase
MDVGIYGFCWGAKMAVQATKYVGAVALVHPAFLEVSDAGKVVAPLCLLDTKDEDKATMDKFIEEVKKKDFGEKVYRKRYDNTFHGFCAGRANYGDPENAKLANEVTSTFRFIDDDIGVR